MPGRHLTKPPIEYGDGDHLPRVNHGLPNEIIRAMVKSLASEGLRPHHARWTRENLSFQPDAAPIEGMPWGDHWYIGNRVYDGVFGFFDLWPETGWPVQYKTSSRWTRFHHSKRHDEVEELTARQALSLAKNYYRGLRVELLALEDKVKTKYGAFGRSYHIWNPRTRLIEECWDENEF